VITPIVPPGRCRAARRLQCGRCLIPETNLQSISRDPLARSRFTRAIHSGRYNGPGLAVLYANRCAAHIKKGETDQALSDCNQAIQLDPKNGGSRMP
jgi:hypothetical protein